jgi:hypothetical protein
MKLSHFLLTTSLCAVVAMPAFAEAKKFSDVDKNGNGKLSRKELFDAFGAEGAESIWSTYDTDGDGDVSLAEVKIRYDKDESDDEDGSDDSNDDDDDDDDSDESDETGDDDSDDDSDESDETGDDDSDDDSDESDDSDDDSDESGDSDEEDS